MLIPILVIGKDIDDLDRLVHEPDGGGLDEAGKILSKPAFEKKIFKKTFNAFGAFWVLGNCVILFYIISPTWIVVISPYEITLPTWLTWTETLAHFTTLHLRNYLSIADNIYYSDPDRANLYLGGGATPKNEQSIAYLLRNDILTNVENLQAEVVYLIKEQKAGNPPETEDLYKYAKIAKDGMKKYLDLVPPSERTAAEKIFSTS